jgi:hypothetical protein
MTQTVQLPDEESNRSLPPVPSSIRKKRKKRQRREDNVRDEAVKRGECGACALRALGVNEPVSPGCTDCTYQLGIYSGAKERAHQSGAPFLVSPAQVASAISLSDNCSSCSIAFTLGGDHFSDTTPTLLPVNPRLGFVLGNLSLECVACNRLYPLGIRG